MAAKSRPRRILVADDEEPIRRLLEYTLRKEGFEPVIATQGLEAIAAASEDMQCALVDLKMPEAGGLRVLEHFKEHHPDIPVVIMSAVGQVQDAVAAMKAGALDYITKPFDLDQVAALVSSAARMGNTLRENRALRSTVAAPQTGPGFAGNSQAARKLLEAVERVAALDSTVLLTGESGTGKGLVSQMIHRHSPRAAGRFIATNCPALPRELIESELFGHERGAFTGAQQRRIGRLEMAEGGTLFLDEIGDLPLPLQPKLLNVLQDRQFTRIGGSAVIASDVRIIAATNADLPAKIAAGGFRQDLYYRLNVIPLHIPPLRERMEDLPALCQSILARIAAGREARALEIDQSGLAALARHSWPGNVRELENVLEHASAFSEGRVLGRQAVSDSLERISHPAASAAAPAPPALGNMRLDDVEKMAVEQTLERCGGNKAAAARSLGVTEKTIYNMLARLGLR